MHAVYGESKLGGEEIVEYLKVSRKCGKRVGLSITLTDGRAF